MTADSDDRTLLLTERVPATVRLSEASAHQLMTRWRHVVSLVPLRHDTYRLTPRGYVGVLPTPDVRLIIRPKIPLRNVFFMLDPTEPIRSAPDSSEAEPASMVFDFLASYFVRLLAERLAAGLHRDYVSRDESGPFLRGRLDVPAQMRETQLARLHCTHDDFTLDIPCNQALVATAERLLQSNLCGAANRVAIREVLANFTGIQRVAGILNPPAPREYVPLLELCQLLDNALRPGEFSGPRHGPAFLLDLGRAFERFIATALKGVPGLALQIQPTLSTGGSRGLTLRPDLVIEQGGMPPIVADTKWKRKIAAPADIYQVVTYATALNASRAVLIYPSQRNARHEWTVGPIRVEALQLNVAGNAKNCRRSLRYFIRELTKTPGR
jgi:5-methylcytosine-specific restriction enzyme subunit McrC